ncbi:nucleotidyltransferase substrate binding protein [uncultured Xylophilus sp.]|uniref:nucleotidyltransferase substrate binding protein n=1 Tax=uncultured Xylophilus sp. TaxID=296832 RepID=UPI0025E97B5E|nr:nucleotidyltransferase substrate binding protein [uncultured Xylophilus sp.]
MADAPLDLSALRSAVASLEDGLEVVRDGDWFGRQSAKVQNTLIAGVIQNFEFVYEVGYKMLRRQIEREAASPADVDESNFRDVLRLAGEKGLVADVEAWFDYRKMRNVTAHTYDHEKARKVYQGTLRFIEDARALLAHLEARNG